MAATEMVESIKFKADGLPDIESQVRALFQELQAARRGQESLAKALADPAFAKAAREVDTLRRRNQELAASQQAASRLAERTQAVYSGDYLRRLREEVKLKEELRRVEQMERAEQLRGRYGRLGGAAVGALTGRVGSAALGGLGLAGGFVAAQARAGMEGTAELAAFRNEVALAQRSLAGAFKPALDGATTAATRVRRVLDGLSGSEQNILMGGTFAALLAGGGFAARMANNISHRALGTGLAGLAFGGPGGAAAGSGVGGLAATAGGSYLGAGGRLGGLGGVARFAGPAAVAYGAVRDWTSDESFYKLGREAGQSKLAAAGLSAVSSLAESVGLDSALFGEGEMRRDLRSRKQRDINDPSASESYYRLRREAGEGRGASAFGYLMDSGAEFFGAIGEKERAELRAKKMRTIDFGRQSLTQAGGGFEMLGGGFDRATIAKDQLAASDYTVAGGNQEVVDKLTKIEGHLEKIANAAPGNTGAPEKRETFMSVKTS